MLKFRHLLWALLLPSAVGLKDLHGKEDDFCGEALAAPSLAMPIRAVLGEGANRPTWSFLRLNRIPYLTFAGSGGDFLAYCRAQRKWTQMELAARLQSTNHHVSYLETGKYVLTPKAAERYARALRLNRAWLWSQYRRFVFSTVGPWEGKAEHLKEAKRLLRNRSFAELLIEKRGNRTQMKLLRLVRRAKRNSSLTERSMAEFEDGTYLPSLPVMITLGNILDFPGEAVWRIAWSSMPKTSAQKNAPPIGPRNSFSLRLPLPRAVTSRLQLGRLFKKIREFRVLSLRDLERKDLSRHNIDAIENGEKPWDGSKYLRLMGARGLQIPHAKWLYAQWIEPLDRKPSRQRRRAA